MHTKGLEKLFQIIDNDINNGGGNLLFWEEEFINYVGPQGDQYSGRNGVDWNEVIDVLSVEPDERLPHEVVWHPYETLEDISNQILQEMRCNLQELTARERGHAYQHISKRLSSHFEIAIRLEKWLVDVNIEPRHTRYTRWLSKDSNDIEDGPAEAKRRRQFMMTEEWISLRCAEWMRVYDAVELIKPLEIIPHQIETLHNTLIRPGQQEEKGNPKLRIKILDRAKPVLLNALTPYIEVSQHSSLINLINHDTPPDELITCNFDQESLGRIFYEQVKGDKLERGIQGDKTELAKWICLHFRRMMDGEAKEPSYSTVYKYLKGLGFPKYK